MPACASAACLAVVGVEGDRCPHHAAPDLRIVCAWCGFQMRAGVEPVSHGICRRCAGDWNLTPEERGERCSSGS
jgi:hypothetical protein